MLRYRFTAGYESGPSERRWAEVLARGYGAKIRPLCLCKTADHAAMYIASHAAGHVLKRMPNSGPRHDPQCVHYEAPADLSGLGQVAGAAICENPDNDTTTLTLDFALSKGASRAPSPSETVDHGSVRSDGKKLTLRATLHYLLDQARLSRWSPALAGKRSWAVVRRELIAAADNKIAKGVPLNEVLFVPETFFADRKDEIGARRSTKLARLSGSSAARMLLIGEVQDIESARYGHHLVVEHLADLRLRVSDDLYQRMQKQFKYTVAMHLELSERHGTRLLAIATLSQPMPGIYDLEAICLMAVNAAFIPFESMQEFQLLEATSQRCFTKSLRYNLASDVAMASMILHDTAEPTALFLCPPGASEAIEKAYADLMAASELQGWTWHGREAVMPPLPQATRLRPSIEAGAPSASQAIRAPMPDAVPTAEQTRQAE